MNWLKISTKPSDKNTPNITNFFVYTKSKNYIPNTLKIWYVYIPVGRFADWEGEWDYTTIQRLHHRETRSHSTEGWKDASEDNKWMIVQCATFSKNLNPRNIDKSVSDIRIRIRFTFESSIWISVSSYKLTILPDIQPANQIVIISGAYNGALNSPHR